MVVMYRMMKLLIGIMAQKIAQMVHIDIGIDNGGDNNAMLWVILQKMVELSVKLSMQKMVIFQSGRSNSVDNINLYNGRVVNNRYDNVI